MSDRGPVLQIINGYAPGTFHVSGVDYQGPILVIPNRTVTWAVASLAEATLESFQPVIEASPKVELLVIGCGRSIRPVPPALRAGLRQHGIVVEPMDTGAACRQYAVLLGENRRVAAALLPLP